MNQQTQLYQKELKELQDANFKMEKELKEKGQLINNLNEEKGLLLEMRNSEEGKKNPEIEALKNQLVEF